MGYTTEFKGSFSITPPLSNKEVAFLKAFSSSRRMNRAYGPFHVEPDLVGQQNDIIDYNTPPEGQPGLWCQWTTNNNGTEIQWDGGEKFYHAPEWMSYLRSYFLTLGAAKFQEPEKLHFLTEHQIRGTVYAIGEDQLHDVWKLKVDHDGVFVSIGEWTPQALREVFGIIDDNFDNDNDNSGIDEGSAFTKMNNPLFIVWKPWERIPDFSNSDSLFVQSFLDYKHLDQNIPLTTSNPTSSL